MTTVRSFIVREAVREERALWKAALREVRCILPDDAEDVERTVRALRQEIRVGVRKRVG